MDPQQPHYVTIGPKDQSKVQNIIIWIHGLNENPNMHVKIFESDIFKNAKIILPYAPLRYVTVMKKQVPSWFDIKFRSQKSFICPFDQAFSSAQVIDSFQKVLKPLINQCRKQLIQLQRPNGKLIVGGFSQGCGMSLHCFYSQPQKVDAVIGVSGYLFPFTPYAPTDRFHRIIYGTIDNVRPWQYVKVTYDGKIPEKKIVMIEETKHQVNNKAIHEIRKAVGEILSLNPKL